ncbi:aspartic peptidase domain-containing protein [Epithele typhae]|uniref:aspartic peptidase domain-containing protein n=1 Tax=Epithele typhae TaxID=378194 RepID=UPI002008A809|nr:aspartic peptidase domain-containing protein [Epithele typhae]KAH9893132.1 aspartic peptidase domain-containing protein [Epithele typhae]
MLTFNVLLSVFIYVNTVHAASSGFRISTSAAGHVATSATSMGDVVSTNDNDQYTVNITLGGEAFVVQLDTGSSDLWLNITGRTLQFTNTTDLNITEGYGKGSVSGWLSFADMTIGDFSVPNQAFVNVVDIKDMPMTSFDGILGMAFDASVIYSVVQENWGTEAANALARSPITNLFALDPTTPNFFDVQLARAMSPDSNNVAEGVFLISEHDDAFQNITSAPMLRSLTSQHWSLAMDSMTANGTPFAFNASRVPGVPTGKVAAVLDTGFSLPQIPIAAVNAIYESVPGAVYSEPYWVVPCDAAPTVVFTFGGQDIPVHPLDLTFTQVLTLPSGNTTGCLGSFQALTLDPTEFVGFDLLLGDAFLRNVYASFNYGDYQPNTPFDGQGPFVQLLPTTDASTMQAEFVANRTAALALLPPTLDPATLVKLADSSDTPASSSASSPDASSASVAGALDESTSSSSGSTDSWGKKYGTPALALLGANLAVGVVLLGLTITMCMRSHSQSARDRYAPVGARPFKMQQGDEEERTQLRYND